MVSLLCLWFLHPGFGRSLIFFKNTPTERSLKCVCYSVDWRVTEWWLKVDWNLPFPSPFSRHSATIQSPFSRLKGEILSSDSSLEVLWDAIVRVNFFIFIYKWTMLFLLRANSGTNVWQTSKYQRSTCKFNQAIFHTKYGYIHIFPYLTKRLNTLFKLFYWQSY